jgi:hypothetical protein
MKNLKRVLLATAALAAVVGCSTTTKSVRVPKIGVVAKDLERHEYTILGTAEGKACVEQSCFLGIFCTVKDEGGSAIAGAGLGVEAVTAAAEDQAMLKALSATPEADAVFSPRKSMTVESSGNPIFPGMKACVRVFGKSVRIKTDDEMKGITSPPPPPMPAPTPTPAG